MKSESEMADMKKEDWENLRKQLRVLVDVYCEMNDHYLEIEKNLKYHTALIKELHNKPEVFSALKKKKIESFERIKRSASFLS